MDLSNLLIFVKKIIFFFLSHTWRGSASILLLDKTVSELEHLSSTRKKESVEKLENHFEVISFSNDTHKIRVRCRDFLGMSSSHRDFCLRYVSFSRIVGKTAYITPKLYLSFSTISFSHVVSVATVFSIG